jgi:hypothetical protein
VKSKAAKTGYNMAEFSKEDYGSKSNAFPMMMIGAHLLCS